MKEISIDESKQIQLDLLSDIHNFCEENGLTYYLIFGSLIGAVRHKGFIPWDDDIDICMPRKDYLVFQEKYNQHPSRSCSRAIFCETDDRYYYPFGKLIDTRTVLNESVNSNCELGVYVDIFPLDYLSQSDLKNVIARFKLQFFRNVLCLCLLPGSNRRKGAKKVLHSLLNKVSFLINMNFVSRIMNSVAKNLNQDRRAKWMGIIANVDKNGINRNYKAEWFDHKSLIQFEGRNVYIPANYSDILTYIYGDYMTLPPVEKQVSLHVYNQYWK